MKNEEEIKEIFIYLNQYKALNLINRAYHISLKNPLYKEECLNLILKTCIEQEYLNIYSEISKILISEKLNINYSMTIEREKEFSFKQKKEIDQKISEINNYKNLKSQQSVRQSYLELSSIYFKYGNFKESLDALQFARMSTPKDFSFIDISYQLWTIKMISKIEIEDNKLPYLSEVFQKDSNEELNNMYISIKTMEALFNISKTEFNYGFKIIKDIIKHLKHIKNIEIFSSWKDLSEYFICLMIMSAPVSTMRTELIEFFNKEEEKLFLQKSDNAYNVYLNLIDLDFSKAIKNLQIIFKKFDYDIYLDKAKVIIIETITDKLMKQFLFPYKRILISDIGKVFFMNEKTCKEFLLNMIKNKQINFLIDSKNDTLIYNSENENKKAGLYKKAVKVISHYIDSKSFGLLKFHLKFIVEKNIEKQLISELSFQDNLQLQQDHMEEI